MTGLNPWQHVFKAEISLLCDVDLKKKTIIYSLDLTISVFLNIFMAIVFALLTSFNVYINSTVLYGMFISISVFTIVLTIFMVILGFQINRHKIILLDCVEKVKSECKVK